MAFFPALPLAARLVHFLPGLAWPDSVILASQLGAAGFWWWLLALLDVWKTPPRVAACVVIAVLAHPASFYMVAGYSESFFLMALAALICCSEDGSYWGGVYGAMLTATRILGLPLAIYPLLRRGLARGRRRFCAVTMLLTAADALAFVLFCQLRFGEWDLYFHSQRIGWNHVTDYLILLRPTTYQWSLPFRKPVLVSMATLIGVALAEIAVRTRRAAALLNAYEKDRANMRAALWIAAVSLFYLTAAGCANSGAILGTGFFDFSRYSLPIAVLAVFAAADLWRVANPPRSVERIAGILLVLVACASLIFLGLRREAIMHFGI